MGFFVGGGGGGGAGVRGICARLARPDTGQRTHMHMRHTSHTHTPPGVLLYREDAGRPGSLSVTRESGADSRRVDSDRAQRSLISRLETTYTGTSSVRVGIASFVRMIVDSLCTRPTRERDRQRTLQSTRTLRLRLPLSPLTGAPCWNRVCRPRYTTSIVSTDTFSTDFYIFQSGIAWLFRDLLLRDAVAACSRPARSLRPGVLPSSLRDEQSKRGRRRAAAKRPGRGRSCSRRA